MSCGAYELLREGDVEQVTPREGDWGPLTGADVAEGVRDVRLRLKDEKKPAAVSGCSCVEEGGVSKQLRAGVGFPQELIYAGLEERVSLEEAEGQRSEAISLAALASGSCEREVRGEARMNLSGWQGSTWKWPGGHFQVRNGELRYR